MSKARMECPVPDCTTGRSEDHWMCKHHWPKAARVFREELKKGESVNVALQLAVDAATPRIDHQKHEGPRW